MHAELAAILPSGASSESKSDLKKRNPNPSKMFTGVISFLSIKRPKHTLMPADEVKEQAVWWTEHGDKHL